MMSHLMIYAPQKFPLYLDPGTGSIIIQAILAAVMGVFIFLGIYRKKVSKFLRGLFKKNKKTEEFEPVDNDDDNED